MKLRKKIHKGEVAEFAALRAADEKEIRRLIELVESCNLAATGWMSEARELQQSLQNTRTQLAEAKEVLENILSEFAPDHMDAVSRSDVGTKARALLEKWKKQLP